MGWWSNVLGDCVAARMIFGNNETLSRKQVLPHFFQEMARLHPELAVLPHFFQAMSRLHPDLARLPNTAARHTNRCASRGSGLDLQL